MFNKQQCRLLKAPARLLHFYKRKISESQLQSWWNSSFNHEKKTSQFSNLLLVDFGLWCVDKRSFREYPWYQEGRGLPTGQSASLADKCVSCVDAELQCVFEWCVCVWETARWKLGRGSWHRRWQLSASVPQAWHSPHTSNIIHTNHTCSCTRCITHIWWQLAQWNSWFNVFVRLFLSHFSLHSI